VETVRSTIRCMRMCFVFVAAGLLVSGSALAGTARAGEPATAYSIAVARVCAGALLFDHAHPIGTRAGALAVARDIRASTARRLRRVEAIPAPTGLGLLSRRWITLQRLLAASYARAWVLIYDTIAAVETHSQPALLATRLQRLLHTPDALKRASGRLELRLRVPDCTGGG